MVKTSLLLATLFISTLVHTQVSRVPTSLTYTRLTAYSRQFKDAFSFTGNLGALGAKKKFSAGIYSERRFMLKDLSSYSAAVVLPAGAGNFGLKGNYFGGQLYNEALLGLAYARELGSKVAVGIQFNYVSLTAAGYGSASAVNVDAGAIIHLSPQLAAGVQVYNPVGTTWAKEGVERLPAVYTAGIGYDVSKQVFIGLEAEKTDGLPFGINAGLQYAVAANLIARAGVRSATSVYYLGFGVQLKHFRLDATASIHPYLGTTPGLLLLYSPKE